MSSIVKDAYEGSWTQQFIAGISNFFGLDMREQAYILLRFYFDHPFLSMLLMFIIMIAFVIIIASVEDAFEKYNSSASREKYGNDIKNLCGGLFLGVIFLLISTIIFGRAFDYYFTFQQGWLIYLTGSFISFLGVRKYKIIK